MTDDAQAIRRAALLATGTVPAAEAPPAALTVVVEGRAVAPAFQLTATGAVRPELVPILAVLRAGAVRPWTSWVWLTTPTGLLSGGVPEMPAVAEPGRVLAAARRFAAGTSA